MRNLPALSTGALARRWAEISRLVSLRLFRDRFAEFPAETTIYLGERTQYVADLVLEDFFDREDGDLGDDWADWSEAGFDGLTIVDEQVEPAAVGVTTERFEIQPTSLDRDQWAQVTIRDLESEDSGGRATVGVVLRSSAFGEADPDAYVVVAQRENGAGSTRIGRIVDGAAPTWIEEVDTEWQIGQTLRVELDYRTFRVYQDRALILTFVDTDGAAILTSGRAGVEAVRTISSDAAALDDFAAGPLRREYAGLLLEVGDLQARLGDFEPTADPARVDFSVVNLAAIGGKERFAALIRHGINSGSGTYDHPLAEVTVKTALTGAHGPLMMGGLLVDDIDAVTEERARVVALGRDAFLDQFLEAGVAAFIENPDFCAAFTLGVGTAPSGGVPLTNLNGIRDMDISPPRTVFYRRPNPSATAQNRVGWTDDPYTTSTMEVIDDEDLGGDGCIEVHPTTNMLWILRDRRISTGPTQELRAMRVPWSGDSWNFGGATDVLIDDTLNLFLAYYPAGIHLLPDGRLMATWTGGDSAASHPRLYSAMSLSDGLTWQAPVQLPADPGLTITNVAFRTVLLDTGLVAGIFPAAGGLYGTVFNPATNTWSSYFSIGAYYTDGFWLETARFSWAMAVRNTVGRLGLVWHPAGTPAPTPLFTEFEVTAGGLAPIDEQFIIADEIQTTATPVGLGWLPFTNRWAMFQPEAGASKIRVYARDGATGAGWTFKQETTHISTEMIHVPRTTYCDRYMTLYHAPAAFGAQISRVLVDVP